MVLIGVGLLLGGGALILVIYWYGLWLYEITLLVLAFGVAFVVGGLTYEGNESSSE